MGMPGRECGVDIGVGAGFAMADASSGTRNGCHDAVPGSNVRIGTVQLLARATSRANSMHVLNNHLVRGLQVGVAALAAEPSVEAEGSKSKAGACLRAPRPR